MHLSRSPSLRHSQSEVNKNDRSLPNLPLFMNIIHLCMGMWLSAYGVGPSSHLHLAYDDVAYYDVWTNGFY